MDEKYCSLKMPWVKYTVTGRKRIDRTKGNLTIRFCYTEDYYGYIRKTCIRIYPVEGDRRSIVGYLKKICFSVRMKETVYAAPAWQKGYRED